MHSLSKNLSIHCRQLSLRLYFLSLHRLLSLIPTMNLEAIWLKASLCSPELFGGLFSFFLRLRCLFQLCTKAELELELIFILICGDSSFQRSLSVSFVNLSCSFILYSSLSVSFTISLALFPKSIIFAVFILMFLMALFLITQRCTQKFCNNLWQYNQEYKDTCLQMYVNFNHCKPNGISDKDDVHLDVTLI